MCRCRRRVAADQGGAETCPAGQPVRRCTSSRHPTASKPTRSGPQGTSGLAGRLSRTTSLHPGATCGPAPARPQPVHSPTPRTRQLWVRRGRRRHRRRCQDNPATRAGLLTVRTAVRVPPGRVRPAPRPVRQLDGGVCLEDRRDSGSDRQARRRVTSNPGDLDARPNAPRGAALDPLDHNAMLGAPSSPAALLSS